MGDKVGYSRVSSNEQHPEVQTLRLNEAGCARVFEDKGTSGKLASRPQWDACLAYLRPGDTLVCIRLDRIGRSVKHLIQISEDLRARQIDLVVIEQGLDTRTAAGRMMFHILGSIAEFESDLISESDPRWSRRNQEPWPVWWTAPEAAALPGGARQEELSTPGRRPPPWPAS